MSDLRADLLARADAWCAATGKGRARLGRLVVKDSGFFPRIAAGGGFTVATYEKFLAFFEANPLPPTPPQGVSSGTAPERGGNLGGADGTDAGAAPFPEEAA